jgi:hypothetical protein
MAIPIPKSVSRVLRRRRLRFFHTNPGNDSEDAMKSE